MIKLNSTNKFHSETKMAKDKDREKSETQRNNCDVSIGKYINILKQFFFNKFTTPLSGDKTLHLSLNEPICCGSCFIEEICL